MKPEVITGNETMAEANDAVEKLIAFYKAFNQQNMELMRNNWLQNDEPSMSNPLGGVKRGWQEIEEVYDRIFNGPARVYVEYYDYSLHQAEDMFMVVGRERGFFQLDRLRLELKIRTSRTYCLSEQGWRQLHHHGSIDNPDLLKKYQRAVAGS